MSIGEQIKGLRKAAKWFDSACFPEGVKLANEAVDTIEALSAKLAAATPKRPLEYEEHEDYDEGICPICGEPVCHVYAYCPGCGQHLKWGSGTEKSEVVNIEQSAEDCGGGWIYCGDGKNLPEIERDVLLSTRSLDVYKGYRANTEGYFYAEGEGYILYENVLAWMPQPEPYHEP